VNKELRGSDAAEFFFWSKEAKALATTPSKGATFAGYFWHHAAMAVPWLQIVQLVPSILDVSRELMKRTKQAPPVAQLSATQGYEELAARVASLEENERRQAELVAQMAEQLAGVARAVTDLHRRVLWLTAAAAVAVALGAAALWIALV
jgi:hypothetical protein